jgi:hypothetical protein
MDLECEENWIWRGKGEIAMELDLELVGKEEDGKSTLQATGNQNSLQKKVKEGEDLDKFDAAGRRVLCCWTS